MTKTMKKRKLSTLTLLLLALVVLIIAGGVFMPVLSFLFKVVFRIIFGVGIVLAVLVIIKGGSWVRAKARIVYAILRR